jgi:hypothetical protein
MDEQSAPQPRDPRSPPGRVRPGWAPFLQVGTRVVIRYAIDRSTSPHGEGMTDALGVIEAADEDTVTVATKRGSDRVVRGLVTAARPVPDPPRRPRPRER